MKWPLIFIACELSGVVLFWFGVFSLRTGGDWYDFEEEIRYQFARLRLWAWLRWAEERIKRCVERERY